MGDEFEIDEEDLVAIVGQTGLEKLYAGLRVYGRFIFKGVSDCHPPTVTLTWEPRFEATL